MDEAKDSLAAKPGSPKTPIESSVAGPPSRFAGDLWAVFNFGDPNERYQRLLARGRFPLKGLLEALVLHPTVYVPTEDYLSLTVLVGTLGEPAVIAMLEAGKLKIARLRGSLAYVGNGMGLRAYQIGSPERKPRPHAATADEAIHWALSGLAGATPDRRFVALALDATTEIALAPIEESIRHETYMDIMGSPRLRARFAISSTDLDRLGGIGAKDVRIYGGPDATRKDDEIDAVLALGAANIELRLASEVGADDVSTASPVGHLLKAKAERVYDVPTSQAFAELREIAGIPDVGEAVLAGSTDVPTLIKISDSPDGITFRTWFHENCRRDTITTAREYAHLLQRVPGAQKWPAKTIRFIVTTGLGAIPGIGILTGALAGVIDSFVLDRILHGRSPKYFIDSLKQLTD